MASGDTAAYIINDPTNGVKLLIDMMPLASGGGVQVAAAFLEQLLRHEAAGSRAISWRALAPDHLRRALPAPAAANARVQYLPKNGTRDLIFVAMRLRRLERSFEPDVVFTVFGPAYFKARAPHVVGFALPNLIYHRNATLRRAAGPLAPLTDLIKRVLVRRADHHVVETEVVRDRLSASLGIEAQHISVIGNSVNPLLAECPPRPPQDCPTFSILVPAAYYPHKNLEILPSVAAALSELQPGVAFEFLLTIDPLARHWTAISDAARAMGVGDRIRTLGSLSLPMLAEAYQRASAVLLPTIREASTAVYPESFHFERPLVTSDLDFAHALCGDAALYCDPRDASSFARALALLIEDYGTGEVRGTLVENGRRRLATIYPSAEEKFAQQLALLQQVARKGRENAARSSPAKRLQCRPIS